MAVLFVPDDFDVPLDLKTEHFRLEPVGPQHNERDHQSWMSSIEHIQNTPGFPHGKGKWPAAMSLEKNLVDQEQHELHLFRQGYLIIR